MLSIQITDNRTLWKTVDLKEKGQFQIQLQKPTWEDLTADSRREPGYLEQRLRKTVIGWDDVEIAGERPAFSWEAFQRVCEAVPAVFHLVSAHVSDLYYSFGETEEKNSGEASSDS